MKAIHLIQLKSKSKLNRLVGQQLQLFNTNNTKNDNNYKINIEKSKFK